MNLESLIDFHVQAANKASHETKIILIAQSIDQAISNLHLHSK